MRTSLRILSAALSLTCAGGAHALTFNYTFTGATTGPEQAAFMAAGARWSALFSDPVTVNLKVGTAVLSPNVLAEAGSTESNFVYSAVRAALLADALGASDLQAVNSLPNSAAFSMLINRTSDSPNGAGSATPYVDSTGANNSTIRLTNANAKALGLATAGASDGEITFSSVFSYDLDPSNGITPGQLDFVGIATHEIGHALGFISGVDILDFFSPPSNGPFLADQFTFVSALDLFRYSAASRTAGLGVRDFTADTRAKYFSLDGGTTVGPTFSTGLDFGDGRQASHWKDNLGLGIMDPTFGAGELGVISAYDIQAFDVIGWNLAAVPEPGTYALFVLGLAGLAGVCRRQGATVNPA